MSEETKFAIKTTSSVDELSGLEFDSEDDCLIIKMYAATKSSTTIEAEFHFTWSEMMKLRELFHECTEMRGAFERIKAREAEAREGATDE